MDIASLKKARNGSLDRLTKAVQESEKKNYNDDRFWQPTVGKEGNGYAVIRFLPEKPGEDFPFVKVYSQGFQAPGGWFIENCPTTIGKDSPCAEMCNRLWQTGLDSDKEEARKMKRKLHYISNVYVIKDPGNPANEGKVFLFKYGKKIFDKINSAMNPEFEDDQPMNPFDLWEGASFKLKIRKVEGQRNYDMSEFEDVSQLFDDDSKLEKVWNAEHSLQEFLTEKNFKTYTDLAKRLHKVLGDVVGSGVSVLSEGVSVSQGQGDAKPAAPKSTAERFSNPSPTTKKETVKVDDEDGGSMEYEKKVKKEEAVASNVTTATAPDDDDDAQFFAKLRSEARG